jgi:hypothetical protein
MGDQKSATVSWRRLGYGEATDMLAGNSTAAPADRTQPVGLAQGTIELTYQRACGKTKVCTVKLSPARQLVVTPDNRPIVKDNKVSFLRGSRTVSTRPLLGVTVFAR